ncbi:unnamed protein product [Rotaria magnacalcarata]|uniref:Dynein heavy chain ATP-binding dynein motor region domain-containing protein n=1 Tax=Rotaria magnacalcarata TaxID=392030 RepID=A0A8S2ITJ8_9BILA|nr:unnamed protein product [Rotaria magnacalcarata]
MCAVKRIDRVDIFKLGDYKVEYIKDFRFYMITKLPNPYYISKRFLKANLINFAAKEQDLESQLPLCDITARKNELIELEDQL